MDYVNSSIKITEYKEIFTLQVEYLVANDADVVEELARNYGPNPPRTKDLLLSLKRKFGEGSKDKEETSTKATENPSASFNPSSGTDPFDETQQKLRSDLHMRDRGCVVTKSPECVASHIIDHAWQKLPGLQGLPDDVKKVIKVKGIYSPCNAILLNRQIDSLFDSKKLSIVPVDAQGVPISWPLYVKESNMEENVPASYKLWAFNNDATPYHLKPVLFEPYVLNADNKPEFPNPILMQHHFMQSLFFNLQCGGSFESDDDDDDNDDIVPMWEVLRQDSEHTPPKKHKKYVPLDDRPTSVGEKIIEWIEGIKEIDVRT
ncbi:hypothetical protein OnM2_012026 [Erysiphe neolycopersici]|uniref:HNH nuclease domain-containing protein n=1 Tax=Erysiphe neolycopersici TaxID=212602 RepID=A0A420I608_9PEZI|nr:hypothetical protein OnM2_012026 [Erysiphe neolycopersici]